VYDQNFSKSLVCIIQIVIISLYTLAAIQALKRKKRYEKQLQQIDGTLSTIEMQREALEGANTNTAVLQTMKNAADARKAAHQHM
jgi:charged multivesicular body protein 4